MLKTTDINLIATDLVTISKNNNISEVCSSSKVKS